MLAINTCISTFSFKYSALSVCSHEELSDFYENGTIMLAFARIVRFQKLWVESFNFPTWCSQIHFFLQCSFMLRHFLFVQVTSLDSSSKTAYCIKHFRSKQTPWPLVNHERVAVLMYRSIASSDWLKNDVILLVSIFHTSTKKEQTKSDNSTKKYFSKVRKVHVRVCCVVGFSRG
jgi:hypothetical protein